MTKDVVRLCALTAIMFFSLTIAGSNVAKCAATPSDLSCAFPNYFAQYAGIAWLVAWILLGVSVLATIVKGRRP